MNSSKTTIKELVYALLDMVNGGLPTDDSKINYRVAKVYLRSALAYHIRARVFQDKNNSEDYYTGNVTTKPVPLQYDETTGLHFIEQLGESVDLGGMRSFNVSDVSPVSRWSRMYVPITAQEAFNQRNLPSIPDVIQYFSSGDKLYFMNEDVSGVDTVLLSQTNIIPSDDNDSVPSDVGTLALNEAYRLAYAEIVINSDRSNDGTPNN